MNAQYFINKFEAIPEEEWTMGTQQDREGRRCAFGHCMPVSEKFNPNIEVAYGHETKEGVALKKLFVKGGIVGENLFGQIVPVVAWVNNGNIHRYQQPTPKQRMLAALNDILILEEQDKAVQQTKEVLSKPMVCIA